MTENADKEKESFLAKAESALAQGLYQMAQDIALDWLTRFPDDADARVIACHAWTRMGKLDKVEQMLREVDGAILGMSRIYARMGDICLQSGLNREATAFYQRFITLNPDAALSGEIAEKLSSILSAREDTDSQLSEEESFERISPMPGLQTVTMAELYVKQGHPDMASKVLEEILKKDKTNHRAAAMLGELQTTKKAQAEKPFSSKPEAVIRELNRWLNNLDRMERHAA
ncbi:MAG TPA: hypothetical protein VJZ49_07055 [Syntrophales bacterium]|nr:hypothetical protein [Syntrophales bacterium]